jgi:hypothetical protein
MVMDILPILPIATEAKKFILRETFRCLAKSKDFWVSLLVQHEMIIYTYISFKGFTLPAPIRLKLLIDCSEDIANIPYVEVAE